MMNERIEELAEQCYVRTGSSHTDHFEYWKFAELIVKECAQLFPLTFTDEEYQRRIDKTILKHFGVIE